jgi:hypothetical protein
MGAAIEGFYHPADWVLVDAVGRTGGVPIIVAKDIFRNAGGWTEMAAGLALARAGDADGVGYVTRLLDMTTSSPNASDDRMSSAERDDPNGLRARDFLLERLGAEVDERFVPELLRMIDRAPAGSPLRAQAWRALLRMNPVGSRSQILGRAWKQEGNESAFRFIALHDPDAAKAFLSRSKSDDARTRSLRRALGASERERRVWRELRGYTF